MRQVLVGHRNSATLCEFTSLSFRDSGQEIRLKPALDHFRDAGFWFGDQADGNGQGAANLILQNAQRLIEIRNHEIDQPRAQALAKTFSISLDA